MPVIDAVEILRDIRVDHPSLTGVHDAIAQCADGVMRRPFRPEPERAVQKVLLVDRLQQHHDCLLRHLILQGRDTQRSPGSIGFGDVVASHRGRTVTARHHPDPEAFKVCLEIFLIVVSRAPVDARRAILARQSPRLEHPVEVNQMVQGCEHPLRVLPRLFGYPLPFRVHVCRAQGPLRCFLSVVLVP